MVIASSTRMKRPRSGSVAKAWTEVKQAGAHDEGADQGEREGQDRQQDGPDLQGVTRFSTTMAECSSAVPISQGMKETFSTGSQNHQPPQPSS